ncbi:MAG: glucan biosynthesis protein, partial [Candidatus Omnitrophota bacterium]|nr:glucan biosynthesis protein [Candidatus Omnitrophota bacterium]
MNAWQGKGDHSGTAVNFSGGTREELGSKSLIMDWQSQRNKKWIRVIALLLIVTFVNQDLIWAQGGTPVWAKKTNPSAGSGQDGSFSVNTPVNVNSNIAIPKDVAVTKEVYNAAGGNKTIINIQDAHASLAAQESIASILDSLVTNYDLKVVAIEGSSGYIDTSILRTFPDEKIRKETAKYLMVKGKMSAGEFFSITSDKPIALYGIEDRPLYKENVEQFKQIYEINEAAKADIEGLSKALKTLQDKIYSKDLKELESNSVLHKDGKIGFSDRWSLVSGLAARAGLDYRKYPNVSKLVESLKLERGISFEKANKERDNLIDILSKTLPKQELEQLVLRSLSFKTGKISQGEFYIFLQDLARKYGIDPEPYKDLITYTEYITLYESIDLLEIFEEIKDFENAIEEKLFTNDDQRKLHDISRCVGYINDLFELKLTNGDFGYLTKRLETCSSQATASFVRDASAKYNIPLEGDYDIGRIFDSIPQALDFYRTAEKRNAVMFSNTIKRMTEEGQEVAALITGGYHTRGLAEILRQKETSYLVILPKFDASKGERPYVAILTNKKEPYEPLLKSGQYYLATGAYFEIDPSIPEGDRFLSYREDFMRALANSIGNIKDLTRRYEATSDIIETWVSNYKRYHQEFSEAQRSGTTPKDFTPRSPKEVAEFLRSLLPPKPAVKATLSAGAGSSAVDALAKRVAAVEEDLAIERLINKTRESGDFDKAVLWFERVRNVSLADQRDNLREKVEAALAEERAPAGVTQPTPLDPKTLVEQDLLKQGGKLIKQIHVGYDSETWLAIIGEEKYIVKMSGGEAGLEIAMTINDLVREADFLSKANLQSVERVVEFVRSIKNKEGNTIAIITRYVGSKDEAPPLGIALVTGRITDDEAKRQLTELFDTLALPTPRGLGMTIAELNSDHYLVKNGQITIVDGTCFGPAGAEGEWKIAEAVDKIIEKARFRARPGGELWGAGTDMRLSSSGEAVEPHADVTAMREDVKGFVKRPEDIERPKAERPRKSNIIGAVNIKCLGAIAVGAIIILSCCFPIAMLGIFNKFLFAAAVLSFGAWALFIFQRIRLELIQARSWSDARESKIKEFNKFIVGALLIGTLLLIPYLKINQYLSEAKPAGVTSREKRTPPEKRGPGQVGTVSAWEKIEAMFPEEIKDWDDARAYLIHMYDWNYAPLKGTPKEARDEILRRFAKEKANTAVYRHGEDTGRRGKLSGMAYEALKNSCAQFGVPEELAVAVGIAEGGDWRVNPMRVLLEYMPGYYRELQAMNGRKEISNEYILKMLSSITSYADLKALSESDPDRWGSYSAMIGIYYLGQMLRDVERDLPDLPDKEKFFIAAVKYQMSPELWGRTLDALKGRKVSELNVRDFIDAIAGTSSETGQTSQDIARGRVFKLRKVLYALWVISIGETVKVDVYGWEEPTGAVKKEPKKMPEGPTQRGELASDLFKLALMAGGGVIAYRKIRNRNIRLSARRPTGHRPQYRGPRDRQGASMFEVFWALTGISILAAVTAPIWIHSIAAIMAVSASSVASVGLYARFAQPQAAKPLKELTQQKALAPPAGVDTIQRAKYLTSIGITPKPYLLRYRTETLKQKVALLEQYNLPVNASNIRLSHKGMDEKIGRTDIEKELLSAAGSGFTNYRIGQVLAIRRLTKGIFVELRTGGGKTLALAGAALSRYRERGEKVLIKTHEDALTNQAMEKDRIGKILSRCGAVTGFILPDSEGRETGVIFENGVRRDATVEEVFDKCVIIYGKWDRFVHRHLKEVLGIERKAMNNNKYFSLTDEPDLMLVFGSATPCIISGEDMVDWQERISARKAINEIVKDTLLTGKDLFYVPKGAKEIFLTDKGHRALRAAFKKLAKEKPELADILKVNAESFAIDALKAHLFYKRDEQYYFDSGKVYVRDEHTGAKKAGMSFGEGLQQAIEIMAGAIVTPEKSTLASMTIGEFENNKDLIIDYAGASGTMEKDRFESMYNGKKVETIEGDVRRLDKSLGHTVFRTRDEKWQALGKRLRERFESGQPVFIKVNSDSDIGELRKYIETNLGEELERYGIIVNEANGSDAEAFNRAIDIAGYGNVLTITTNIAHRGIDITIKGRYLNKDGSEGAEVPPIGKLAPGLHVISGYLDEAEAFEIQTQGRADRGANKGSWEGLSSLDEKVFKEHLKLLNQQLAGLRVAIEKNDKAIVERLISEIRERITSEKNRSDEKRRQYEEEVFAYQQNVFNLLQLTASTEIFAGYLKNIDAYDSIKASAKDEKALTERIDYLRLLIRRKLTEELGKFQTEQQATRKRLEYLSSQSQVGLKGALIQFDKELANAIFLARNFNNKISGIKGFIKVIVASAMGDKIENIQEIKKRSPRDLISESFVKTAAAITLAVGIGALFAKYGLSSVTKTMLGYFIQSLSPYALILGVAAAALLIITIYLNQIYGKKINHLDTSTTDFMRFTAGIGQGSFIKAFFRWVGVMALQLLSGPGLFAAGGTLIAAIAHPVLTIGTMTLPAIPLAFISVLLALLANIILISIFKKALEKVRDVTPTRFQSGVNSFVRAIALSIGILFALQVGGGALAITGISIGAIAVSLAAATIISQKTEKGYFEARWPSYIGSILGIAVGAGLIILSSIFGTPAVLSSVSIIPFISAPTAVIGILVILFQVFQAWKVAKEASSAGQNLLRTFVESFIPNSRNIVMYALAIPAIFILFGGIAHAILFVAAVGLSALLINAYNVNFEKRIGRAVSEHLSGMIGKVVMVSAGAIPMIVYPQAAYSQQMQTVMSEISGQKKVDSAAFAAALKNMNEYSPQQMAGVERLGRNIDNVIDEVANGKLIPAALASPAEITASRLGEERAPPAVTAAPAASATQAETKKKEVPSINVISQPIVLAQTSAGAPSPTPPEAVPQPIKAATYDQYQKILPQRVFNNGMWKVESKPTGAASSLYNQPIKLYLWDGASKTYRQVMYRASEDVGKVTIYHKMKGRSIPPEILTFNGSGYVRFSAEPQLTMGATMRIGAHNAGEKNEEFPRVTEARVRALSDSAYEIILTMDSEIYSGTVNIKLTPGKRTTTHVEASYKMKRDVDVSKEKNTGFLALSSMYGVHPATKTVVHDTDMITVKYSDGTIGTRQLTNPTQRMSVSLDKPGSRISAFSLEQKDRDPSHYKDRAAKYYARSSYGVRIDSSSIPLGLMLNIDPTESDNSDNVYPVLVAKNNLRAGQTVKLIYDAEAGAGITPMKLYVPSADERVADEIVEAIKPGKAEKFSAEKLKKYSFIRSYAEKLAGLMFGGADNIADSKFAINGLVILFGNSMDKSGLTPDETIQKLIAMINKLQGLSQSLVSGGVELPVKIDTNKPLIWEDGLLVTPPPAKSSVALAGETVTQTEKTIPRRAVPSPVMSQTKIGGVDVNMSISDMTKGLTLGVGTGSAALKHNEKTGELEVTVNGTVNKIASGRETQLNVGSTSVVIHHNGKGMYLIGINGDVKVVINPQVLPAMIMQSFAMRQAQHNIERAEQHKKEVSAGSKPQAGINYRYDSGISEKFIQDARDSFLKGQAETASVASQLSATFASAFLKSQVDSMKSRLAPKTTQTKAPSSAVQGAGARSLVIAGQQFSIKALTAPRDDGGLLYEGIVASRYSNEGVATFNFSAAAIIAIAQAQGITLTDDDIIGFAEGAENAKITEVLTNFWRDTPTSGFLKADRDYSILTTTSSDGRELPYVVFNDNGNIRIASLAGSSAANMPTLTFTIPVLKSIAESNNITITDDEIKALAGSNMSSRLEQILMKVFDNANISAFLKEGTDYVVLTATVDNKEVPYAVFTDNGSLKIASFTGSALANTPTTDFTKDSLTKLAGALGIDISADEIQGLANGHISSRIEQLLMKLFDNATTSRLLTEGRDYKVSKTTINGAEVPYIVFTDNGKIRISAFADSSLANQMTATFTEEALRTVLAQKGISLTPDERAGLAKGQLSVRLEQMLMQYFDGVAGSKLFVVNKDYTVSTQVVDGEKVPYVVLTDLGQTKVAQHTVGSLLTVEVAKAGLGAANVSGEKLAALSSALGSDVAERLLANAYGLIQNDLYRGPGFYQVEHYDVRDPTTGEIKPLEIVTLTTEGKKLLVGVVVTAFRDGGTVAIAADTLKTLGLSDADIEAVSQGKGLAFAERLESAIFKLVSTKEIEKLEKYYEVTQTTVTTDTGETITAPVAVLTTRGVYVFKNIVAVSNQITKSVEAGMKINNLPLDIAPGVASAFAEEIVVPVDDYWKGMVEEKIINGQKILQLNDKGIATLNAIFQEMGKVKGDVERILGTKIDPYSASHMGYWIWASKYALAHGGKLIPSNSTLSLYAQMSYSSYLAREKAKAGLEVNIEKIGKKIQAMQIFHKGCGLILDIRNIDSKISYLERAINEYKALLKNDLNDDPMAKEGLGKLEERLRGLRKARADKERELKELSGFDAGAQAFIVSLPQAELEKLYEDLKISEYNLFRVELEKLRVKAISKGKPEIVEWDVILGGYADLLAKPIKPVIGMRGNLSFDQMSKYARRMAQLRAQSQEDSSKEIEISAYYEAKDAERNSKYFAAQEGITRERAVRTGSCLDTLKKDSATTPNELVNAALADTFANLDAADAASEAGKARLDTIAMSSKPISDALSAASEKGPMVDRARRGIEMSEEAKKAQKGLSVRGSLGWSYDGKGAPTYLPSIDLTITPGRGARRELSAAQVELSQNVLKNAIKDCIRRLLYSALDMMQAKDKVGKLEAQLKESERRLKQLKSSVRDSQTIIDIKEAEVEVMNISGNLNTAINELDIATAEYEKTKALTGMDLAKESLTELSLHNIDDLLNNDLVVSIDTEAPLKTADLTAKIMRLSVKVAGKGKPITIALAPDLTIFLARNAGTIIDLITGKRARETRRAKREAIASRVAWDKQNPHVVILGNNNYQIYEDEKGKVVIKPLAGQSISLDKVPVKEKPALIKIGADNWRIYFNEKEDNYTLTNTVTGVTIVSVRSYYLIQKLDKEEARKNFAIAVKRLDWANGLVDFATQKLVEARAKYSMGLITLSDIDNYNEALDLAAIEQSMALRDYGKAKFEMESYGVKFTDEEARQILLDQNNVYYVHKFTSEAWSRATDQLTADQEAEISKVLAWRDSLQSFEFSQYVSVTTSTQNALILPKGNAFNSKNVFAVVSVKFADLLAGLNQRPEASAAVREREAKLKQSAMDAEQRLMEAYQRFFWARAVYAAKAGDKVNLTADERRQAEILKDLLKIDVQDLDIQKISDAEAEKAVIDALRDFGAIRSELAKLVGEYTNLPVTPQDIAPLNQDIESIMAARPTLDIKTAEEAYKILMSAAIKDLMGNSPQMQALLSAKENNDAQLKRMKREAILGMFDLDIKYGEVRNKFTWALSINIPIYDGGALAARKAQVRIRNDILNDATVEVLRSKQFDVDRAYWDLMYGNEAVGAAWDSMIDAKAAREKANQDFLDGKINLSDRKAAIDYYLHSQSEYLSVYQQFNIYFIKFTSVLKQSGYEGVIPQGLVQGEEAPSFIKGGTAQPAIAQPGVASLEAAATRTEQVIPEDVKAMIDALTAKSEDPDNKPKETSKLPPIWGRHFQELLTEDEKKSLAISLGVDREVLEQIFNLLGMSGFYADSERLDQFVDMRFAGDPQKSALFWKRYFIARDHLRAELNKFLGYDLNEQDPQDWSIIHSWTLYLMKDADLASNDAAFEAYLNSAIMPEFFSKNSEAVKRLYFTNIFTATLDRAQLSNVDRRSYRATVKKVAPMIQALFGDKPLDIDHNQMDLWKVSSMVTWGIDKGLITVDEKGALKVTAEFNTRIAFATRMKLVLEKYYPTPTDEDLLKKADSKYLHFLLKEYKYEASLKEPNAEKLGIIAKTIVDERSRLVASIYMGVAIAWSNYAFEGMLVGLTDEQKNSITDEQRQAMVEQRIKDVRGMADALGLKDLTDPDNAAKAVYWLDLPQRFTPAMISALVSLELPKDSSDKLRQTDSDKLRQVMGIENLTFSDVCTLADKTYMPGYVVKEFRENFLKGSLESVISEVLKARYLMAEEKLDCEHGRLSGEDANFIALERFTNVLKKNPDEMNTVKEAISAYIVDLQWVYEHVKLDYTRKDEPGQPGYKINVANSSESLGAAIYKVNEMRKIGKGNFVILTDIRKEKPLKDAVGAFSVVVRDITMEDFGNVGTFRASDFDRLVSEGRIVSEDPFAKELYVMLQYRDGKHSDVAADYALLNAAQRHIVNKNIRSKIQTLVATTMEGRLTAFIMDQLIKRKETAMSGKLLIGWNKLSRSKHEEAVYKSLSKEFSSLSPQERAGRISVIASRTAGHMNELIRVAAIYDGVNKQRILLNNPYSKYGIGLAEYYDKLLSKGLKGEGLKRLLTVKNRTEDSVVKLQKKCGLTPPPIEKPKELLVEKPKELLAYLDNIAKKSKPTREALAEYRALVRAKDTGYYKGEELKTKDLALLPVLIQLKLEVLRDAVTSGRQDAYINNALKKMFNIGDRDSSLLNNLKFFNSDHMNDRKRDKLINDVRAYCKNVANLLAEFSKALPDEYKDEADGFATALMSNKDYIKAWIEAGWITGHPDAYKLTDLCKSKLPALIQLTRAFRNALPDKYKDEAGGFATPLIMNSEYMTAWKKAGWIQFKHGAYKVTDLAKKNFPKVIQLTAAFREVLPQDLKDKAGGFATPLIMNGYINDWIKYKLLNYDNPAHKYRITEKGRKVIKIFVKLGALDGLLARSGYIKPDDRDGVKMAIAKDLVMEYSTWAEFFNRDGSIKNIAKVTSLFTHMAERGTREEVEGLLRVISKDPHLNLNLKNNKHAGFLMTWVRQRVLDGWGRTATLANRYKYVIESESFSDYMRKLGVSGDFRSDLAEAFASQKTESEKRRYSDLVGNVSFFATGWRTPKEIEHELINKLRIIDEFSAYFGPTSAPVVMVATTRLDLLALTTPPPMNNAVTGFSGLFSQVEIPQISIDGVTITNYYDLSKALYLLERKAEIKKKNGEWSEEIRRDEEVKFEAIFAMSNMQSFDKIITALNQWPLLPGQQRHIITVDEAMTNLKMILDALKDYPLAEEMDTAVANQQIKALQAKLRLGDEIHLVKSGALRKMFFENQRLSLAMFWFKHLYTERDPHTIKTVVNDMTYRKNVWNAYLMVKDKLGTPLSASDVGFLADLYKDNTKDIGKIFFDRAVVIQDFSKIHLGRIMIFDELTYWVGIQRLNYDMPLRSQFGEYEQLPTQRMARTFSDILKEDPSKANFRKLPDERVRLALWSAAPRLAKDLVCDLEARKFWLGLINKDLLSSSQKKFYSLLNSGSIITNSFRDIILNVDIVGRAGGTVMADRDEMLKNFMRRRLLTRLPVRELTSYEKSLDNEEFIKLIVKKLNIDDPEYGACPSKVLNKLNRGDVNRKEAKAILTDLVVMYKDIKDAFNKININPDFVFEFIDSERAAKNREKILFVENVILMHLISDINNAKVVKLTPEEESRSDYDII